MNSKTYWTDTLNKVLKEVWTADLPSITRAGYASNNSRVVF